MSAHASLTTWNVSQSIKHNLNAQEAIESYEGMMSAAEYEEEYADPTYILSCANYMLTQNDGLYGVSHEQIRNWLVREGDELCIRVLKDIKKELDNLP